MNSIRYTINFNLGETANLIKKRVAATIRSQGQNVYADAKTIIRTGYNTGRLGWLPITDKTRRQYQRMGQRTHPGLISPYRDRKKLKQSIHIQMLNGGLTAEIYASAAHAAIIEGDGKPSATRTKGKPVKRPFLNPALEDNRKNIIDAINAAIAGSL